MTGWMWSLATVLGPILLLGVVLWAMTRNRKGGSREIERAERGARELREDIEEDEARDQAP